MTISSHVHQQFYQPTQQPNDQHQQALIRLPPSKRQCKFTIDVASSFAYGFPVSSSTSSHNSMWTIPEHERFLQALELFPKGPWKYIAAYVGNKTARQAMSHAQKYRQKIARHKRGLQVNQHSNKRVTKTKVSSAYDGQVHMEVADITIPRSVQKASEQPQLQEDDVIEHPWTQVRCPSSPTEVSIPATMELSDWDWTTLPEPVENVPEHMLESLLDNVQPAASFSELLSEVDEDHEVIVNSVNEFLDSLEEDAIWSL